MQGVFEEPIDYIGGGNLEEEKNAACQGIALGTECLTKPARRSGEEAVLTVEANETGGEEGDHAEADDEKCRAEELSAGGRGEDAAGEGGDTANGIKARKEKKKH